MILPILNIISMALTTASLVKKRNFLIDNYKPIITIGAALSAGFLGYKVYRYISAPPPPSGGLDEDLNQEKTTLSPAQAKTKSDRLENAMRTFSSPNEDELTEIRAVLQDMTYNDFIAISKAFGDKRYVSATGVGGIWPANMRNLSYWLVNELDTTDLNELGKVIPGIF